MSLRRSTAFSDALARPADGGTLARLQMALVAGESDVPVLSCGGCRDPWSCCERFGRAAPAKARVLPRKSRTKPSAESSASFRERKPADQFVLGAVSSRDH